MFFVRYHPAVWQEDFPCINKNIRHRIKTAIENRLQTYPMDYGKPLRGNLKNIWSLRVGDYRIAYQLKENSVIVLQVVLRKDAYQTGILEARKRGFL